jgi:hypothetical protein
MKKRISSKKKELWSVHQLKSWPVAIMNTTGIKEKNRERSFSAPSMGPSSRQGNVYMKAADVDPARWQPPHQATTTASLLQDQTRGKTLHPPPHATGSSAPPPAWTHVPPSPVAAATCRNYQEKLWGRARLLRCHLPPLPSPLLFSWLTCFTFPSSCHVLIPFLEFFLVAGRHCGAWIFFCCCLPLATAAPVATTVPPYRAVYCRISIWLRSPPASRYGHLIALLINIVGHHSYAAEIDEASPGFSILLRQESCESLSWIRFHIHVLVTDWGYSSNCAVQYYLKFWTNLYYNLKVNFTFSFLVDTFHSFS